MSYPEVAIGGQPKRIFVRYAYAYKDVLKLIDGKEYDPALKAWKFPAQPEFAREIHRRLAGQYRCDQAFKELLDDAVRFDGAKKDAHKYKTATDLPDTPTKTEAWTHQRQAFHFGRGLPAVYLGMDMGTGKSLTAIALLEEWNASRVLIVCPKSVLAVWPHQFAEHALRTWDVCVPPTRAPIPRRAGVVMNGLNTSQAAGRPFVAVLNYEAFWRHGMNSVLQAVEWDAIVYDEAHRLKAPGGKQSKFAGQMRKHAKRVIMGSGTPLPHTPLDIYGQYRAADPTIFGRSFNRFKNKYGIYGGFEMRQLIGIQNEAELAQRMGQIMYTCKADDVLDLPPYHFIDRYFDLEPSALKVYNGIDNEFVAGVKDGTITADNALVKLLRLQQITGGHVKDDEGHYHHVSSAKQDMLADILEDFSPHEPIIVICRFTPEIDSVVKLCESTGRRVGELSGRRNTALIDPERDPRMREDIDIAVVQIQAGGVGIDLTRAAYTVYYSVGYALVDYEQSLKRTHRPGQKRATTYIRLMARGTRDEAVYAALAARKNVVEAMIEMSRQGGPAPVPAHVYIGDDA